MNIRRLLPCRTTSDTVQFEEVRSILREANRADPDTLAAIAAELRAQASGASPRVQVEIDGVIARFRALQGDRAPGGGASRAGVGDGQDGDA